MEEETEDQTAVEMGWDQQGHRPRSLSAVEINVVHNNDRGLRKLQRVVLGLCVEESQRECRDVQTILW